MAWRTIAARGNPVVCQPLRPRLASERFPSPTEGWQVGSEARQQTLLRQRHETH
jgi:hypothetical protein